MKLLKTLLLMVPLALYGCSLFPEHMHPGHVFTDNTKLTWGFKDSKCNYNLETKLYDL